MPSLRRTGDVFVLDLGDDENRFSPGWLTQVSGLLDEVAGTSGPRALVTTATGKFFSNGLDLDWLGQHPDQLSPYIEQVQELFARVLAFPVPTVAAIQGHAFAAGAMLALAHDWRVMRADRGFFCLPEIDLAMPFPIAMDALVRAKLLPATATDAMTTGRRYGGDEALAAGIVTEAVPADQVLACAVARVEPLAAKDATTLGTIKTRMYAAELAALHEPFV